MPTHGNNSMIAMGRGGGWKKMLNEFYRPYIFATIRNFRKDQTTRRNWNQNRKYFNPLLSSSDGFHGQKARFQKSCGTVPWSLSFFCLFLRECQLERYSMYIMSNQHGGGGGTVINKKNYLSLKLTGFGQNGESLYKNASQSLGRFFIPLNCVWFTFCYIFGAMQQGIPCTMPTTVHCTVLIAFLQ